MKEIDVDNIRTFDSTLSRMQHEHLPVPQADDKREMKREGLPTLVFTRKEAAKLAGVGLNTLDSWIKQKSFPIVRGGRRVLIPARAFERFLTNDYPA